MLAGRRRYVALAVGTGSGRRSSSRPTAQLARRVAGAADLATMRRSARDPLAQRLLAAFFIFAGIMHFVRPRDYEAIVPPSFPPPRGRSL